MIETFVPCHIHTIYSVGDGIIKLEDYMQWCKENNVTAATITDHGVLNGTYQFQKQCKLNGIKSILGEELYVSEAGNTVDEIKEKIAASKNNDDSDSDFGLKFQTRSHVVLYVRNNKGWKNLLNISNKATKERFYRKPLATHLDILENSDGLIATTACIASKWSSLVRNGKEGEAKNLLSCYKESFGENFFIEIQTYNTEEIIKYNDFLLKASKELNIPLLYSLDAHYIKREDVLAHATALAIDRKQTINLDEINTDLSFYLKTKEQIIKELELYNIPMSALENTNLIAERCNFNIAFDGYKFPNSDTSTLEKDAWKKLKELGLNDNIEYKERLQREMKLLKKRDFFPYFALLRETIDACKGVGGLIGKARGSAGGSLTCYLLGITDVDPIKYNLSFERFITENRGAVELDLDF